MVNKGRRRAIPKGSNLQTIAFISPKEAALQKETEEKIRKLQEETKKRLEEEAKIQKMKEMEDELLSVRLEKEKLENFMEYKPVHTKDEPVYGHFLQENPEIEVKIYDKQEPKEKIKEDNNVELKAKSVNLDPAEEELGNHTTEMNAFQASLQDFFKDVPVIQEQIDVQEPIKKVEKIITPPIETKAQQVDVFNDNYKQLVDERNRNLTPQYYTKTPEPIKVEPVRQQEIISPISARNVAVVGRGRAVMPISRVASRVAK